MSRWVVVVECNKCWKRYYDCWCTDKKENPEVLKAHEEAIAEEKTEPDEHEKLFI